MGGGGGELLTQDYQLNNSLTLFFSGPNERIGILKFAFELLQCQSNSATGTRPCNNFPGSERPQLTQLGKMEVWQGWALVLICSSHALSGNILKKYLLSLFPH